MQAAAFAYEQSNQRKRRSAIRAAAAKREELRDEERDRFITTRVAEDHKKVVDALDAADKQHRLEKKKKIPTLSLTGEQKMLLLLLATAEKGARDQSKGDGYSPEADACYQSALSLYAQFLKNLNHGDTSLGLWDLTRESVGQLSTLKDFQQAASKSLEQRIADLRSFGETNFANDYRYQSIWESIDSTLVDLEDLVSSFEDYDPLKPATPFDWVYFTMQLALIASAFTGFAGALFALVRATAATTASLFAADAALQLTGIALYTNMLSHQISTGRTDFKPEDLLGESFGKVYSAVAFTRSIASVLRAYSRLNAISDATKRFSGKRQLRKVEAYMKTEAHELHRYGALPYKSLERIKSGAGLTHTIASGLEQIRSIENGNFDIHTLRKLTLITMSLTKKYLPPEMTKKGVSYRIAFNTVKTALKTKDYWDSLEKVLK